MSRSLLVGTAIALIAGPALAADIDCGRADLVRSAHIALEACVDQAVWQPREVGGDQEFVYFSKDGMTGFAIITETPTVDMSAYHDAILAAAGRQTGGDVASYDDGSSDMNGKTWRSMHYDLVLKGTELEFLNYYYSEDGLGSAQFIFWSLPGNAATLTSTLAGKVMASVSAIE